MKIIGKNKKKQLTLNISFRESERYLLDELDKLAEKNLRTRTAMIKALISKATKED